MRLLTAIFLALGAAMLLPAQTEFLKPDGLPPANGYSHAVTVAAGSKMVFLSGQIANDAQGHLVGKGDLKAQTEQVFRNLKAALAGAGTSFENVVKLTFFIRDYTPQSVGVIREVRNQYIRASAPPASTLVGVAALVQPDYLLEVEAIAVVPDKATGK